jgi:hypothetical protein
MQTTSESHETELHDAITRLRAAVHVPPPDPARERALLAAFDARRQRPTSIKPARWVWATAALLLVSIVGLNWLVMSNSRQSHDAAGDVVSASTGFVPWPGSEARPPFESGSLVRVDLPVSALSALGLAAPSSIATVVQADIVIGQDGFARAVRLVQ